VPRGAFGTPSWILHAAGAPYSFLDFRRPGQSPQWLSEWSSRFDGLFFIDEMERSTPE
jgi:hypothetical protein